MIKSWIYFFSFSSIYLFGQTNDWLYHDTLANVIITSYKEDPLQETSLNITPIQIDSLNKLGNFTLTDLLTKVPGVNALSTGLGIAKPVIRGLYGNRVLVLLSGLKFDNQQWQEEHGLGLSDIGLSKVELIKGPVGILYGSEAMGGIINLIEEQKPLEKETQGDVSLKLNSNTMGGTLQTGYKVNYGKKWFRIRVGLDNHADYSDGNNHRVLNSRFDGYYLKGTFGFQRKNWISTNNLMSSFNRFGFIFNDIYSFVSPDARWNRALNINPTHLVLLNILSSENKISLRNGSKLNINLGAQSNQRMENEGGGAISLNMHLLTLQYMLKWEHQLSVRNRLVVSHYSSYEDNTNFGARKIVPDATMQESNVSLYLESHLIHEKLILENGAGVGQKWIKTYFTALVNGPSNLIKPFSKFAPYYNVYTGLSIIPSPYFNFKLNVATGVRIANLAELSSNGLHEGVFTYEIGSPLLKNEQNICLNLLGTYSKKHFEAQISPFYNQYYNYIYLAPTTEEWFGFPVYRYRQQNAQQYGSELSLIFKHIKRTQITVNYAGIVSKAANGEHLPFTPAQKLSPSLQYKILHDSQKELSIQTSTDIIAAQNQIAPHEIATPSYWLLNIVGSYMVHHKHKTYTLSVMCNNLLNKAYYDHLSRFKYFGILNIGRNISVMLSMKFKQVLKQSH